MDRVRFGRALGVGARQAAKSLMSAAEAAAAPDPRRAAAAAVDREQRSTANPKPRVDPQAVVAQARTLRKSAWGPFAKFSSVLWLEVTGTFFAIFALTAGLQIWKVHGALLAPSSPEGRRLCVYLLVLAVFGYFAVSNFVRAGRRQRR